MSPERKHEYKDVIVEEFYWNGRAVVYVNHAKYEGSYEDAVKEAERANERRS